VGGGGGCLGSVGGGGGISLVSKRRTNQRGVLLMARKTRVGQLRGQSWVVVKIEKEGKRRKRGGKRGWHLNK